MKTYYRTSWLAVAAGVLLLATACGGESVDDNNGGSGGTAGTGGSAGEAGTGGSAGVAGTGGSAGVAGTGGTGTGGTGGTGTGGTGGTGIDPGPAAHVDKLDLLFMIDNSASMADKQKLLAASIPDFVNRLASPHCIDANGAFVAKVGVSDACPDGSSREFPAVTDMHIGVVSSSLGGHGADSCSNTPTQNWNPRQEDMSHLLDRNQNGTVPTYESMGFLNWDPGAQATPPGEADPVALAQRFADIATGADQDGCGFESSLEAWYRFLVDPAPYERMIPVPCYDGDTSNQCRGPEGIDSVVLQQRADFLRPDSAVGIVMLTDENDCSVIDDRQYFLALQALDGTGSFHLAHSTNACKSDPYASDCKSCWEVNPADFPECAVGWPNPEKDDTLNLRCYRQKERFGIDFLYPVERYISALTETHLEDGTVNPLFCNEPSPDGTNCIQQMRDRSQVVLTGIVGVPWQDIANDPNDLGAGYKRATDVDWNMILGDPMANVEPTDPLMVEAVDPRSGANPVTGATLASPGSGVDNPINGAEVETPARNNLQYACIFKLAAPLDCTLPQNMFGCECNQAPESPLCWNGSSYGTMQHYGKAYPGRRHLAVLEGIDSQAVVASICAPNLTDPTAADYGYGPALNALVNRLGANLR